MPVEFTGPTLDKKQRANVDRIKMLEQEEEKRKRMQLLDLELGEVKDRLTPDQYNELLDRQRNYTDFGKVNQSLQWHEIQRLASEKGTEDAVQKADQLLGKEGKEYLNSIGPRTGPANREEFNAIMNSPAYRKSQRKFNEQAGRAQGREFEFVDKVAGYEDRASTYAEGLAAGVKAGLYPGGGKFDDHVFDDDVFKRRWADSRKMDKWQLDAHSKALKQEINAFEETRQKLTENYQRMDPFGRTQYKEMEKKVKGLERARQEGRLRPLEYLRHMSQLADRAKTIQWNFHMKAPGGEVGDIFDKDGDGGFYQRQPDGTLKMVKMSDEYFDRKTKKLDDGLWLIPTIDKDGREVMKEVKGGRPGVDWKEQQEWTNKLEKYADQYAQEWLKENDSDDMETAYEYGQQKAAQRISQMKSLADQLADPNQENPDADPEAFVQAKTEAEKQAAYEEGQKAAKERALKQLAQQRVERRKLVEALAPVSEVMHSRGQSFRALVEEQQLDRYDQELQQWMQENKPSMDWMDAVSRGENPGPPPEYLTPKPKKPGKPKGPDKELGGTYDGLINEAETNEELRHFIATAAMDNPALKHLMDNPIPVKPEAMRQGKYLRNGFVYSRVNNMGVSELFLRHKGKWFPLGPQDMNEPPVVEDNGFFGNMIGPTDHGNDAANLAAGGNL